MYTNRNKGFTLLELLIGITAAMVIMAIGLGVARSVSKSSDAMAAQTTVMQLTASIKAVFAKADYTGLTSALLIQSGTVPAKMIGAGNLLISPWGSTIEVTRAPATAAMYQISVQRVPSAVCSSLIGQIQDSFAIVRVDINGGGGGEIDVAGAQGLDAPSPGVTSTIKDETAPPPVAFTTAAMVAACKNANTTIVLLGS